VPDASLVDWPVAEVVDEGRELELVTTGVTVIVPVVAAPVLLEVTVGANEVEFNVDEDELEGAESKLGGGIAVLGSASEAFPQGIG